MDASDTDIMETAGNNWSVSRAQKRNCEGIDQRHGDRSKYTRGN